MVQLLSPSRLALAVLSSPFLLGGVSAMFGASSDITNNSNSVLDTRSPNYWEAKNARDVAQRAPDGPRWAVYHNTGSQGNFPSTSDLKGFNVYYFTFLLSKGPWDMARAWVDLSDGDRARIKGEYNAAGIKLMVAAFGATEEPTTAGADPVATAQQMAGFVKQYGLDGIDVDYEDFTAMSAGTGADWLIRYTNALREQLPRSQGYLITHAPVAPWFSPSKYPASGYLQVHKEAGNAIDWYNLQFYNQGTTEYTDCAGLLHKSSSTWPQTALFEIVNNGVPTEKLVVGKPAAHGDANNGFIATGELAACLSQAKEKGWNGGAMAWQYPHADSQWIESVRSQSFPV